MEIIPNKNLPKINAAEPKEVNVEPNKVYSWCSCGLSLKEPFCDGSHKNIEGTPFGNIKIMFTEPQTIFLCRCKQTKTPPYCDNSHLQLK